MIDLSSFELLKNDVFYRSYPILEYLRRPNLDDLDYQAIMATIMDALVSKKLIDPQTQFLDMKNLCITNVKDDATYSYQKTPFVMGIPLWIKEESRKYCPAITGFTPISFFISKTPSIVHFCVYDVNTALSIVFDEFTFLLCDYDSPTRIGQRAKDRPFLEAKIEGVPYLFDLLTKRGI